MTEHLTPSSPEVHEVDHSDNDLYPEVQHTIDDLKEMADKYEETSKIERTASGEPILPAEVVDEWLAQEKYKYKKAGTYNNESTFVYFKSCNFVDNKEEIDKAMTTARELTELGAIHPESQWVVKEDGDKYLLVVVSPKLEAWDLSDEMEGKYDDRSDKPSHTHDHLIRWFRRIDPDFTPDKPLPEDSPLRHLNWHEATHPDNWGWDATGTLFPIDVEVLNPTKQRDNREPWKRQPAPTVEDLYPDDDYFM